MIANEMNWQWGDVNAVVVPVDGDMTILKGDLVFVHEDHVYPADMFYHIVGNTLQVGLERTTFAQKFLGIALQRHLVGNDQHTIRVATSGVFALDLKEGEIGRIPGKYVGVWFGESKAVSTKDIAEEEAIGIVADTTELIPKGKVFVNIASTICQFPRRSRCA